MVYAPRRWTTSSPPSTATTAAASSRRWCACSAISISPRRRCTSLPRRAGAVAARRGAGQPARLARLGRALQGDRRASAARARFDPLEEDRRAARAPIVPARPERDDETHRGRSAAPDLHLLPSGALARRAGGADAARGVRPDDRGDRARVSHAGADARAAHRAREDQDPRRAHPVRGAGRAPSCRSGSTRCCASSTSSSTRATRRRRATRPTRADLSARRSGSARLLVELLPEPEAVGPARR